MAAIVESAPATEAPQRASFGAWWMLAVLFGLYVFSFLDRYIISMMVQPIKEDLGLTDFQMGLVLGPAFAIFYAVFGIPLGWASDRFSRRWVIFLGVSFFGLATFSSGLAQTFGALLAARMFVGIGEAALSPAAYSLLADRFPRNRLTTAISIYTMGIKVGSASAFALGGVVIALAASLVVARPELSGLSGWQLVFMATGLPAVLLALLVFTFPEPPRRGVRRAAGAAPDTIIRFMLDRKRLFVPMLIGFSLISLCSYSLNGWVPTYLDRHFGMKPIAYGPLLGAISMAAALTLAVKGAFVDWLYSRGMKDAHLRFYTWLLMGALPVAATLFFVESPAVFLVMYGALQVVAIPIIAYMSAAMQLITPSDLRGRITAVFLFCLTVLGGGVGPLLVSAITDYVFHDDAKVGWSLALVTATTMPLALISLRLALKPLAAAVVEAEQRDRAPA